MPIGKRTVSMSLKEMLELWVKITGVNPQENQTRYTIYFDDRLSDYDIEKMNQKIQDALGYDETGLFAEAYLCHFFKIYIEKRGFHLNEYLQNDAIQEYLADVKSLHSELQKSSADQQIMEEAQKAMDFYQLSADQLTVFDIAEVRTCANNCIQNLQTLQFSSGQTQKNGFKMSRDILMYKNLNSLIICAAQGKIDGVSMAYIRDENQTTNRYFAFVIKNGGNLYLLTDKPSYVHPLQSSFDRCPGRTMDRRISGNLFPYTTIANIDTSDLWGGGRYGTREMDDSLSTILSDTNGKLYEKIGTIESMDQTESFWYIMMLALIKEKFYDSDAPQFELSYTGNQINHPLIAPTTTALMVQSSMPSIELAALTHEDIEGLTFDHEGSEDNWNQYLIDRYKDQLDTDVYNIMDNTDNSNKDRPAMLHPFNIMDECGTKEQINYNQRWIARYNYAKSIQQLLQDDYEQHYVEIEQNIRTRMECHLEGIVVSFLQGNIIGDDAKKNIGYQMSFDEWWNEYPRTGYRFGSHDYYGNKSSYRCALTGQSAGVVVVLKPKTAKELALICRCEVSDLPEQIQNWSPSADHYCGNQLLRNIDPMKWVLEKDPFNKMKFSLSIILSKREYLRLCSVAGIEQNKFWLDQKPTCFRGKSDICYGKYRWNPSTYNGELLKKCPKCKYYRSKEQ